jgi:O-antigen/teichoic acid export membrane protein
MLTVIFINKLYDESITSNMGLCMQVLGLPLALISTAVSQVLYQKAVEFKNQGLSIMPFLKPLIVKLGGLSLIGLLLAYFLSEPLFALIYGADYVMAGEFAVIIVFAFALKFIISPLSMVFPALDKIKVSSLWQCIYFLMICSLLFLPELDIYQFLYIYLGIELLAYSLHAVLIFRVINAYEKNR